MPTPSDLPPPMNHVFVDFENMHEVDASLIGAKTVSFTLLLGAKQTKLDVVLVEKLMAHSASVQLIRLTGNGKNAVDFALAYYLGQAVLADPTAYFHLVSKDKGYDPLIEHLRSRHVQVRRHEDFKSLSFGGPPKVLPGPPARPIVTMPPPPLLAEVKEKAKVKAAVRDVTVGGSTVPGKASIPAADLFTRVVAHLRKNLNNRPRRKKTLATHLLAFGGKTVTVAEVAVLIEQLREAGHLSLNDKDAVSYHV